MYVKVTNGQPTQFPYTVGQLRRDNPRTSFPKVIPEELLRNYGVHPVEEGKKPEHDPLVHNVQYNGMPTRDVVSMLTEADCTDPITGAVDLDSVGKVIYGNKWFVDYSKVGKPREEAEANVRRKRDQLISETDWTALSDTTMSAEMTSYRQALRDITAQEGFPYSVVWPTKP